MGVVLHSHIHKIYSHYQMLIQGPINRAEICMWSPSTWMSIINPMLVLFYQSHTHISFLGSQKKIKLPIRLELGM